MQVVALIKRACIRRRIRIEVDGRAEHAEVLLRIDLQPARTTRRDELLKARCRADATAIHVRAYLATACEAEAQPLFGVVIQHTEQCERRQTFFRDDAAS